MGTQGLVFKDLGVEPGDLMPTSEPNPPVHQGRETTLIDPTVHEGTTTTLTDTPTESHELAMESAKGTHPDEAGAAQVQHAEEVVDLGWNEPKELVAKPLVGGMANEDLWLLVRRFNKVRFWRDTLDGFC
jgi:hypothetical protein